MATTANVGGWTAQSDPSAMSGLSGNYSVGINSAINPFQVSTPPAISWLGTNANSTYVSPQGGTTPGGSKLGSDISQGFGLVKSAVGNVSSAVNQFGANNLGYAGPSGAPLSGGSIGPTANGYASSGAQGPTNTFGDGSFTNALGGQAFGSGGFLGSLGSSGLDTIGNGLANFGAGWLGHTLGDSVFGGGGYSSVGSTIGGAIGSIWGPLGTIAGSFIGDGLGSLFGGGKPHPASEFAGGAIGANGATSGASYGSKHMGEDNAKSIENGASSFLQQQSKKYGVTYADGFQLSGGYDPGVFGGPGGAYIISDVNGRIPDTKFQFDPNDPKSVKAAQLQAFNLLATQSGYDPNNLTQVNPYGTTAHDVTIPAQQNPSQWQAWLQNYRDAHTSPAPTPATPIPTPTQQAS